MWICFENFVNQVKNNMITDDFRSDGGRKCPLKNLLFKPISVIN